MWGRLMYSSPSEMIRDLAGMPLTVLMALFFSERLPMSETAVGLAVGCHRDTARKWLLVLGDKELVFRNRRFTGWDLTQPAVQLKMSFMLEGSATPKLSATRPNSSATKPNVSATTLNSSATKPKLSASEAPYLIDLDRSIDRERDDSFLPPHNAVSLRFLKQLGITGDLYAMAWGSPEETLAAWWACQWGKNPPALLAKHLLDKRPIDEVYAGLAAWRMKASREDVVYLEDLLRYSITSNGRLWRPDFADFPKGVNLPMYNAAVKVYQKLGGLPLG